MAYESYQSLCENNCFIDSTMNDANSKNSYRMVILGAPKVGKSSILNWFFGRSVDHNYVPTIEDFHKKVFKIRGDVYRLDILDTSGNDPFPAMKKLNIMTGDLFILVFSLDNVDSYTQVKNLLQLIVELKKPSTKPSSGGRSTNVPILVLGNKLDLLMDNKIVSRCAELGDIQQMVASTAGPKTAVYTEISALNAMGIETAFERLFALAGLPLEMLPMRHRIIDASSSSSTVAAVHEPAKTVVKTESISNMDAVEANINSIAAKRLSSKLGHARSSSLKLRKTTQNGTTSQGANSNAGGGQTASAASNCEPSTARASASGGVAPENTGMRLSQAARRSFRKVTFRRAAAVESWGAVWLNARRPSIRAELKLLQVKKNPTTFKYHDYESASSSSSSPTTKSVAFNSKFGACSSSSNPALSSMPTSSSPNSAATRNKFRVLVNNFKNLVCSSDRSIKSAKLL